MNEATYAGNCHCGAVRFEVATDLSNPGRCNCSFCRRRGTVLQQVPPEKFHLSAGEDSLSKYGNREFSKHYFCRVCGIHCFTKAHLEDKNFVVVNLGCLQGVEIEQLEPQLFDGARLL